MIAYLEFKARLVIDDQSAFSVDFSNINAFGRLLGDVDKTGLELLDQLCAKIAEHEQSMGIQVTYSQSTNPQT
ncbi:Predicted periplasmic solute-binding protein [Pseudomonas syringae pv. actinidiae]|uniref:Predicted periplasmic solute-binding protein n=1 Tax=Pseudomonas syringae pv. actinidiae TaxID=103796 RepID=A0AAN4TKK8_PSESF|nr:Predicted periplasmic solute-binding protein [Pseudomonas syringae pv. actinidiae]